MKDKELKKMSQTEMLNKLESYKKDLFNLRFQKNNGQLKSPAKFREIRRNVARIKTYLRITNA